MSRGLDAQSTVPCLDLRGRRRLSRCAQFKILLFVAAMTHFALLAPVLQAQPQEAQSPAVEAAIVYLGKRYSEPLPLSLVDPILNDKGLQGARLGHKNNLGTARILGHEYQLIEAILPKDGDVVAEAKNHLADGRRFFVADLEANDLLAVSALPGAQNAVILNIRDSDDRLRNEDCRGNIFHIPPSFAMRADALAQFFAWKKWRRWLLITGTTETDKRYAAAIRRAANRFGAKIVDERTNTFRAGHRRADDGHQQIQNRIPLLTNNAPEHDVVLVADTGQTFGEFLLFRTTVPSAVAGTHGLVPVAWHVAFEQYGGTQMQNRFERLAKRKMTERDYFGWVAVRALGEALMRSGSGNAGVVRDYLLSKRFVLAAFKGRGLTFRDWNRQLRQPILLMAARSLISISPQPGFLHQKHLSDTLGYDEPESTCKLPS